MDLDRETKNVIATVALVAAFAFGMNAVVVADAEPSFMSWSIGLFVVAVLFWIWIRRDDMAEKRESALKAAEDLAKAVQDKAAAQLDEGKEKIEVLAEEVKDSAEQVAEAVEEETVEEVAEPVEEETVEDEPEAVEEPVAEASEPDDLSKIEGIGPVYQQLLKDAGVGTFEAISKKTTAELEQIIKDAGKRRPASVDTWVEQAELAARGDWDALQKLQDTLDGGRRTS